MHTARQLDASLFAVKRNGVPSTRDELLPAWTSSDRLGVVVTEPFGALGASHLIQLAITAFYDVRPTRRAGGVGGEDPRAMYPEIYLFHVGGAHGDHSMFDFWPARKEVFVEKDARLVLDAINDRAVTRLAVPDGEPVDVAHEHKEPAAARDRLATALVYSATGRVRGPEWEIAGTDQRTEANPAGVLDPESRCLRAAAWRNSSPDCFLEKRSWPVRTVARHDEGREALATARRRRAAVRGDDALAKETYRSVDVDTALTMLVARELARDGI
jgi:hypothetical protein